MIKQVRLSGGWMVGLALALVVCLGAPGLVPDARAAEFNVLLQGPDMVLQNHNAELVVVVTDSQGRPANGVPVVFRVAPGWENEVTLSPQSIVTQNGRARIAFRPEMTGMLYLTAQVGDASATTRVTVSSPGSTIRGGGVITDDTPASR